MNKIMLLSNAHRLQSCIWLSLAAEECGVISSWSSFRVAKKQEQNFKDTIEVSFMRVWRLESIYREVLVDTMISGGNIGIVRADITRYYTSPYSRYCCVSVCGD